MSNDNTLLISQEVSSFKKYYLATLGANIAAFSIGTGLGYCSPALYSLNQSNSRIHLSTSEQAWFGAIVPLAALIGCLVSGKTIECFGRKFTLMFGSIPMIIGWLVIIYSYNVEQLFIGRFINGFGIGLLNVAGPIYIAETTPAKVRGLFGLSFPLTMALGVVYSFYFGYLKTWSYLAFYCSVIPAVQLVFMFYLPETPAWLIKHDQVDVATETVFWLYGEDHNLLSVALLTNDDENNSDGKLKLLLTEPRYRTPFLLCVALMFFQQFSGINAVIFYTANILESAKSSIDPNSATIYIGLTQFLTVLISCALVDHFGRKFLLYVSGFLMGISMMILSLYYFYVSDEITKTYGWVPLFALTAYVFSYAIGYGPVPWLYLEVIQTKVRGLASGLVVSSNFFFFFLITLQFKNLSEVLDEKYIFLSLSLISFLSVPFTFFFLFESKGKSLAEIEEYFKQRNPTTNQQDD